MLPIFIFNINTQIPIKNENKMLLTETQCLGLP